jgi:DNA modification methylase
VEGNLGVMRNGEDYISDSFVDDLIEAVHSNDPVSGHTHGFYKYPARFSPEFARNVIKIFTEPGDLVVDPYMGGATTLVEARLLGRRCVGADINELATFLARTKTKIISTKDLDVVYDWASNLGSRLNLHNPPIRAKKWVEEGYQRNINSRSTWPTRKTLELILANLYELTKASQKRFAQCALLKTSQWALDCTTKIPSAAEFRNKFLENIVEMSKGALEFSRAARQADRLYDSKDSFRIVCLNRSVVGIEEEPVFKKVGAPKLILTSPPYPGVHVLYHRWQINGRKETPAPFWIANAQDGYGLSFYTMGDRKQKGLKRYYELLFEAYKSMARIANEDTFFVQMVGFSKPSVQLPKYLKTIEAAGLSECKFPAIANMPDGRLWRTVPNRKWYATHKGSIGSSKEVVLFHKLNH